MADIFICYRRNDSEGYAGRLHDHLAERFGPRAVFVDVDNLHPGVDFEDVIQRTLLRSTVVLVVIGPRWLDQRLKSESDYVRREIIAALKGKKRLIPVLVGDARMPAREKLPPELATLAGKNAVTLRHPTWKADVARLLASLERVLARKKVSTKASTAGASGVRRAPATGGRRKAPSANVQAGTPAKKEPAAKKERPAKGANVPQRASRRKTKVEERPELSAPRRKKAVKPRGGSSPTKKASTEATGEQKARGAASREKAAPPAPKKALAARTGRSTRRQGT